MAFNAAFLAPREFSRVLSRIGSHMALQRSAAHPEGGGEYPTMVRRESKRNIRVWLQDGSADLDNAACDWPAANIGMANALKFKGYDYHFSFGVGGQNNGPRRRGVAGSADVAVARLRSRKDITGFPAGTGGKRSAGLVQLNRK
jgi:hypothetical protein